MRYICHAQFAQLRCTQRSQNSLDRQHAGDTVRATRVIAVIVRQHQRINLAHADIAQMRHDHARTRIGIAAVLWPRVV